MNIITFILIGLCAGWIAGNLVDGHGRGAIGNIVIGILGAFLGGFIFDVVNVRAYGFWGNVAMSVVGAVTLLVVLGVIYRPSRKD